MHELIITEKPSAAKKIAEALSNGKPSKEVIQGVTVYEANHDGKKIKIVSAVGHLFTVAEKHKSFTYPSFDIEWTPVYLADKNAGFSKKYADVIKKVAKQSDSFTVACDYDIEGEVIGLNVIRFLCGQKDAKRMKFSTLLKDEVQEAYENKSPTIDWGQALAGETRHFLDWMYGINLSRALTLAVKKAGSFKILSSGRVQGPALKIIVDRELEIKSFKPEPYWTITIELEKQDKVFEAVHEEEKIWEEKRAKQIHEKIRKEKTGVINSIDKKSFQQAPPFPFDIGSLQSEAYKVFGITPKKTLQCAQNLYLVGLTSYPRTSSQILPPSLNIKKILTELQKNPAFKQQTSYLLSLGKLQPNNGTKTDPAHPPIYPTGHAHKITDEDEKKVYDLITKRFFATFGEPATRETVTLKINVKDEMFKAKGTTTTKKGWHTLYEPYVKLSEQELPLFKEQEQTKINKEKLEAKETQPPKRYTAASIISELEKRGLGTKATRADIVEALYNRGYVHERSIQATELGIEIEKITEKYCPELTDEEFTKKMEEDMDLIREKKLEQKQVLETAKKDLIKILEKLKYHEKSIGKEIAEANKETQDAQNNLGPCPVCKEGIIQIRRGKFGFFAACNKYPECKTTFNLPKHGLVKPTGKISEKGYPIILLITKGKQPMELSLNPEENSHLDKEKQKEYADIKAGTTEKKCPQCGANLRVMSSIYGEFLGCSAYPKCRHTESPTGHMHNGNTNGNTNGNKNANENKNENKNATNTNTIITTNTQTKEVKPKTTKTSTKKKTTKKTTKKKK